MRAPASAGPLLHRESSADIAAAREAVFALLDDHRRLAAHMTRPSLMTAGASMRIELDSGQGQAAGSVIRMRGRVLGLPVRLEEVIVEYAPPHRKTWETLGEPRLVVIGRYRMGFELTPVGARTRLRVWIDYALPESRSQRWLGRLFGGLYANWCVTRMVRDAARARD